MKRPSKEDLLNCFDGMCTFLAARGYAVYGYVERDERVVAIRKLIERKLTMPEKHFDNWCDVLAEDEDKEQKSYIRLMLKVLLMEVGIKVE